jgi:hypothetical protein
VAKKIPNTLPSRFVLFANITDGFSRLGIISILGSLALIFPILHGSLHDI